MRHTISSTFSNTMYFNVHYLLCLSWVLVVKGIVQIIIFIVRTDQAKRKRMRKTDVSSLALIAYFQLSSFYYYYSIVKTEERKKYGGDEEEEKVFLLYVMIELWRFRIHRIIMIDDYVAKKISRSSFTFLYVCA